MSAHMRVCEVWKEWRSKHLTKDVLQRLYVDEQRSMPEIVELLNLSSVSVVYNSLKTFGIMIRSVQCATLMPRKQQRSVNTCIEKYGGINPLATNTEPRRRMNQKLFNERGVTNVFQLPEVKLKIRDSFVSRPEAIVSRYSALHREIVECLESFNLDPEIEFRIPCHNGYRSYDVKIDAKLIEVHGDYWHANPKNHKADDVIKWSMGTLTAQEVWARDEFKRKLAIDSGYELYVIWESDWKLRRSFVEHDMMNYLGLDNV